MHQRAVRHKGRWCYHPRRYRSALECGDTSPLLPGATCRAISPASATSRLSCTPSVWTLPPAAWPDSTVGFVAFRSGATPPTLHFHFANQSRPSQTGRFPRWPMLQKCQSGRTSPLRGSRRRTAKAARLTERKKVSARTPGLRPGDLAKLQARPGGRAQAPRRFAPRAARTVVTLPVLADRARASGKNQQAARLRPASKALARELRTAKHQHYGARLRLSPKTKAIAPRGSARCKAKALSVRPTRFWSFR